MADSPLDSYIQETTECLEGLLLGRALCSHLRRDRHANDTAPPE